MYPSDISREQFETIRPQLESFRKRTRPRTVDCVRFFVEYYTYYIAVVNGVCFREIFPNGERFMNTFVYGVSPKLRGSVY